MRKNTAGIRRLSGSRKGQMPFAIIAVTLLLLGSAYGIIESQVRDSEENSENIETELDAIGKSIEETKRFVERGLGEIIYDLSTDADAGTVNDRTKIFETRSKEWMDFQFPAVSGAVTVSIDSFVCGMVAEPLKLTSEDPVSGGYSPAYLKCTGEFTAEFVSDSGSATRTVPLETDGTCALPLAVEQGSVFSNSVSGSGSVLSQMMTYQLTALAQYRVINGYGALSAYGETGTESIITEEDVSEAYRNSVRALELVNFRTTSDGTSFDSDRVDLADGIASENGFLTIDISAVYSQALISIMDDAVLKWFDYFYGNRILNAADVISDNMKNAWDSMKGFLTGENEFSAVPYIEEVMRSNGYDPSEYRYPLSGRTFDISVPDMIIPIEAAGTSEDLHIRGFKISVPYPQTDLLAGSGIEEFKKHYRSDTNEIREWFRSIIHTAALDIGQSKAFGTIRFEVNGADGETFMETVSGAVRSAITDAENIFDTVMTDAISGQKISDPFYSAIYKTVEDGFRNSDHRSHFDTATEDAVRSAVSAELDSMYGTILDPSVVSEITDTVMSDRSAEDAYEAYMSDLSDCIDVFSALNDVPDGQSGLVKTICTEIFKAGAVFTDTFTDVPQRIISMCGEIEENMSVNAYYGYTYLPSENDFSFTDKNGNTTRENLTVSGRLTPTVSVGHPNSNLSECVHQVGFNDESGASYCTMFTVNLKDKIELLVSSTGGLASAMGVADSAFRETVPVDLTLKIPVTSGWGLAGVRDYKASNTILGDAWNVLVDLLSPLLDPLRKIMSMIMDSLAVLGSALMEVAKYVSAVIEKLYNALIEPLEQLRLLIEEKLDGMINAVLGAAVDAVQWIVGADLSKQTVGFSFMGFTLTISTRLATLVNDTKTLFTVTLGCEFDRLELEGSLTVRQKGSGDDRDLTVTGTATVSGKDWKIDADIDPTMKSSKHLISMNGVVRGVEFDITMPELVQYKEVDPTLSDIPGVSAILSNIPVPLVGLKASIDAGVMLRYDLPFKQGIVINEMELNPPGTDHGNEWIEIYNASSSSVDLDGYTLHAGSDTKKKVYTIHDEELSPRERTTITFQEQFLNNSKESVTLRDPDGKEIDKTPQKSDSDNDDMTWQRTADSVSKWVFADETRGSDNGGSMGGDMIKDLVIEILKDAATDAMDEIGDLESLSDISEFFEKMMQSAITAGIEMIADCIVEASIFATLELGDPTSTGCVGFRIALSVDSDFIEDGLKCLVGEMESILLNIDNPYGIEPKTVLTDNMRLGVTVYTGITAPRILKDVSEYPKVKIGVHIDTNISGLCSIFGRSEGTWKVSAGVVIMDCPKEIIPSALSAKKTMSSDLWLIKAEFRSSKTAES